jgi:hypothetical protein
VVSDQALEMLTHAFAQMGATPEQAPVMAAQLLKRARQVAAERGIPETAALSELLMKAAAGRRGEYGAEITPGESPPGRESD